MSPGQKKVMSAEEWKLSSDVAMELSFESVKLLTFDLT